MNNNSKGSTTNQSLSIDVAKENRAGASALDDTTLSKNQILPMQNNTASKDKHKETAPGVGDDSNSSKNGSIASSGDSPDEKYDDPNPIGIQI